MDDNEDLLDEFITECRENIAQVNEAFLAMETAKATPDIEILNNAFRLLHNIKGSSGFFELNDVETLSHAMEDILNQARQDLSIINSSLLDTLFSSLDKLEKLVDAIKTDTAPSITQEIDQLHYLMDENTSQEKKDASHQSDKTSPKKQTSAEEPEENQALIDAFLEECQDHLQKLEHAVEHWTPETPENEEIIKILQKIEASATFLKQNRVSALSQAICLAVSITKSDQGTAFEKTKSILLKAIESLRALTTTVESLQMAKITDTVSELRDIVERVDPNRGKEFDLFSLSLEPKYSDNDKENEKPSTPTEIEKKKTDTMRKTEDHPETHTATHIRLNIKLIDRLVNLTGELLLIRNQVIEVVNKMALKDPSIEHVFEQLNFISSEIQNHVMQLRLQPMSVLFNKLPRIARDLAKKSDKKIQLNIDDQGIEIDKQILEKLQEPLTHIIRNCIDHGIENENERQQVGKAAAGSITIFAASESGQIKIIISDDGQGIDPNKIIQQAIKQSLINEKEAENLSDSEKINFIYTPGFSTAKKVSEVSGRGVGMDVVKTNIEKLGGFLSVDSTVGEGTRLTIRTPLTLSIVKALIIQSATSRFALPQMALKKVLHYKKSDLKKQVNHFHHVKVIKIREDIIPIVYLDELLCLKTTHQNKNIDKAIPSAPLDDMKSETEEVDKATQSSSLENMETESDEEKSTLLKDNIYLLILRLGSQQFGLLVDDIVDTQELVIKTLSAHVKQCKCFSGASILGSGEVVLILDVAGIANEATLSFPEIKESIATQKMTDIKGQTKSSLLIVRQAAQEKFSLPIDNIIHLMVLSTDKITTLGHKTYYQYQSQSIPLIYLNERLALPLEEDEKNHYVIVLNTEKGLVGVAVLDIIDIIDTAAMLTPEVSKDTVITGRILVNSDTIFCLNPESLLNKKANGQTDEH